MTNFTADDLSKGRDRSEPNLSKVVALVRENCQGIPSSGRENSASTMDDYYEILKKITPPLRQFVALQMIGETMNYLGGKELHLFIDLLVALNKYVEAERDREQIEDVRANWELTSKMLVMAATELRQLRDRSVEDQQEAVNSHSQSVAMTSGYMRQGLFLQIVAIWTEAIEDQQGHFSELLQAMALFAQEAQSQQQQQENQRIWQMVAAVLESAAQNAEKRGKELP